MPQKPDTQLSHILTVGLTDLRFHAFHGVMEQEQRVGNEFRIDFRVTYAPERPDSDDINDFISYADLYDIAAQAMATPRALLEKVAYDILSRAEARWAGIMGAEVTISKLSPPIPGCIGQSSVTLALEPEKSAKNHG